MKIKTTQKAIRNSYYPTIQAGYCELQTLLRYQNAFAYNSGVYGWNCDYYYTSDFIICTGYRPHGFRNKKITEIMKTYEDHARAIDSDYNLPYEKRKDFINALFDQFNDKIMEELRK